jgi:hypothetical protein
MNNPGFYVYQGSSGDWYIDCLTYDRPRIGIDLIRKTDGVWSTKQAAFDALDVALNVMTPGEAAYREDARRRPSYDGGTPRPAWAALETYAKQSWERQPTPREWNAPALT